ncbi:MAG: enoyl-CoA hydratase/isomerase family protein [Acidobacteria bacterium]|nr:enoyl-CoA hydratase/isomerase family protein [Acidobacteriota bacterium]
MGARIAAHFANAGVPSYLMDIVPPDADRPMRNRIASAGLEAAKRSKPAAFFEPSLARLVTVGNFEDDLGKLAEADWIIEAVVEDLDIKRELLKKVEAVRRPGTIITTNTSGLPVAKIAEGFSGDFCRSWFGTHFFNPPRYMRLVEIIPAPATDPALVRAVEWFADVRLGKGVVVAKDTPNFIANRIGIYSVINVMRLMQEMDLTIEEVDALTGETVGWPKSATFRTIDLVGLDIVGHVVANMAKVGGEEASSALPEFFKKMLERKWLGDKTQGGFYKKVTSGGEDERLALDWKTLEYRPRQRPRFALLEMAKRLEEIGPRLRMLLGLEGGGGGKGDKAAAFLWQALSNLWNYSASRVPEIADSVVEVDRAMRLGFNWELGPFELWDSAGVETTVARMEREGPRVAPNAKRLLASGKKSWYAEDPKVRSGRMFWQTESGSYAPVAVPPGVWSVGAAKRSNGVVKKNAGASLVDLGDGVGAIEFHSKMNALGSDIVSLVRESLKPSGPGDDFDAFVITNDAANFSVGANLMLLLLSVEDEEWDEVDLAIREFQGMTQAIKFSPKPVVVAPFGMTLGGGAEVALHAAARQAHAELYIGLVEVGVGLIPAGGGSKEMLLRAVASSSELRKGTGGSAGGPAESVELLEAVKKAFETIATARVATSADEARGLQFLSNRDAITMNRERVVADAKARAIELVRAGYEPPQPRADIPAPGENILATLKMGVHLMRQGDFITEYEVKLGHKIAEVLCGGNITPGTPVSEQYLLDLEREAFKSLCGEKKTQARIQYTLKTGKTLRN